MVAFVLPYIKTDIKSLPLTRKQSPSLKGDLYKMYWSLRVGLPKLLQFGTYVIESLPQKSGYFSGKFICSISYKCHPSNANIFVLIWWKALMKKSRIKLME